MKNFKTIFLFTTIAIGLLLITSCNNAVNVDQLLQNETTRQQVFEKIAADHEMMTGFMEATMNNEHAKMMMKEHDGMKDLMMGDDNMMKMMKDKPEMMQNMMGEMMKDGNMMGNMMKDGKMMGNMMQMMNKEGMMSEECMQSCMKMMGDKGMDMGNMMEGKNGDNQKSHNQ